jgi:DNA-binding PadR family transcriptional regulator
MPPSPTDALPLDPAVMMIILALAPRPLYGYAIMQDVERRSSGALLLQTGALYRTLKRLLDDDLIEECAAPPDATGADVRRRYYRTTPFGMAVIAAELDRMSQLIHLARPILQRYRPTLA